MEEGVKCAKPTAMKTRRAAAWGALVGLVIPIAINLALYIDESAIEFFRLFVCLWPGFYLMVAMGVAGSAAYPPAMQVLTLAISLGSNIVLYATLGWFAWLATRVFRHFT